LDEPELARQIAANEHPVVELQEQIIARDQERISDLLRQVEDRRREINEANVFGSARTNSGRSRMAASHSSRGLTLGSDCRAAR
jgi:hypothetical protein